MSETPDIAALLAAERAYLDRGGRPLGGQGDPVFVHVRERTDMVIAVERGAYEAAVEAGELADLIGDWTDDYRRTTCTVLAADEAEVAGDA